jgi:hypothetical protein
MKAVQLQYSILAGRYNVNAVHTRHTRDSIKALLQYQRLVRPRQTLWHDHRLSCMVVMLYESLTPATLVTTPRPLLNCRTFVRLSICILLSLPPVARLALRRTEVHSGTEIPPFVIEIAAFDLL